MLFVLIRGSRRKCGQLYTTVSAVFCFVFVFVPVVRVRRKRERERERDGGGGGDGGFRIGKDNRRGTVINVRCEESPDGVFVVGGTRLTNL